MTSASTPRGVVGGLGDEAPGWVLVSASGESWRLVAIEDSFLDLVAAGDVVLGTTAGSVSSWTPVPGELARTGDGTSDLIAAATVLTVLGVSALYLRRRLTPIG